jgi:hypothetical protein
MIFRRVKALSLFVEPSRRFGLSIANCDEHISSHFISRLIFSHSADLATPAAIAAPPASPKEAYSSILADCYRAAFIFYALRYR